MIAYVVEVNNFYNAFLRLYFKHIEQLRSVPHSIIFTTSMVGTG